MKNAIILFFSVFGFTLSSQAQTTDWSPFFKSWENGCDSTPALNRFFSNLVPTITWKNGKPIAYKKGSIMLPSTYKNLIKGKLTTRFGDGFDKPEYSHLIKNVMYSRNTIAVNGTYYGMQISSIGYIAGVENGIDEKFIVVNASYDIAHNILQPKIRYHYSDDYVDNYDGEAGIHLKRLNSTQTLITCDLSN